MYIHNNKNWPNFTWNTDLIVNLLAEVRLLQGKLLGRMQGIGFDLQNEAILETLTLDVLKTNEIEGELLDNAEVRSSVAKTLGLNYDTGIKVGRYVEGVVEMMIDATQNYQKKLYKERLFDWHAALFPTGRSGMQKIVVGNWRTGERGPMQVVSGPIGREHIHFEAPDSNRLNKEMDDFLLWFNSESDLDDVLKAAITHLWFITIHPFADGNGRIARAITNLQLARSDQSRQRFYSMSTEIMNDRKHYYTILEKTQKGDLDISDWLFWFLERLKKAIQDSDHTLSKVLSKAKFWEFHQQKALNDRQRKTLNRLLDGFLGKMSTSKWAKINKCSTDTALRDIQDLLKKGMLVKEPKGGRSTAYQINWE